MAASTAIPTAIPATAAPTILPPVLELFCGGGGDEHFSWTTITSVFCLGGDLGRSCLVVTVVVVVVTVCVGRASAGGYGV